MTTAASVSLTIVGMGGTWTTPVKATLTLPSGGRDRIRHTPELRTCSFPSRDFRIKQADPDHDDRSRLLAWLNSLPSTVT